MDIQQEAGGGEAVRGVLSARCGSRPGPWCLGQSDWTGVLPGAHRQGGSGLLTVSTSSPAQAAQRKWDCGTGHLVRRQATKVNRDKSDTCPGEANCMLRAHC